MEKNLNNRKYYEAYEERYKIVHSKGVTWSSDISTPIVLDIIKKYNILINHKILEVGCGEGRDAKKILNEGYQLLATDISNEAINFCKNLLSEYADNFMVLNCLNNKLETKFDLIYSIAVIHMLVLDEDRNDFYKFIYNHLSDNGIALICTMGDGIYETRSDINQAFTLQERDHDTGKMMVTATSCRMVSFKSLEEELIRNNLKIIEKGITSSLPDFNSLMYVVVTKH